MTKRVALLQEGAVVNIADFPDEWSEDVWDDRAAVVLRPNENIGIGWQYNGGDFVPPPFEDLSGYQTIRTTDTAMVVYTNTFEDAPSDVIFDVNGTKTVVILTSGVAELVITPSGPGSIRVEVNRPINPVVIDVEEA